VTAIEFHPDGLVLCVGLSSGKIVLFDVRTQEAAKEFAGLVMNPVKKIGFSNKGIHLAVTWDDCSICRVYSLHKNCEFTDIDHQGASVKAFTFDHYG
jgi:WD40 repeat protein